MADRISEERRSYNMRQIKSSNTAVELSVRSMLHRMGYRYRLHDRGLPGTPDVIFSRKRKVIFVHGCFWHQHPNPECSDARLPKSKQEYWVPKLSRTRDRDSVNQTKLSEKGWEHLVVWECELKDQERLRSRLVGFLGSSKSPDSAFFTD